MKKIVTAVAAVALIGGGGYFYSVQKFATEAGYFKDALEKGDMFKADKIEIKPYQFEIDVTGMSVNLGGLLPKELPLTAGQTEQVLTIKNPGLFEIHYSPLSKKITVKSHGTEDQFKVNHFGQEDTFVWTNHKGGASINLSSTPSLKDKTLGQFIREYVTGMESVGNNIDLRAEGAAESMMSADYIQSDIQKESSELGSKLTISNKIQGEQNNAAAMFEAVAKMMPQDLPGLREALNQVKPSALLKGLKRDRTVTLSVDTNFSAIMDSAIAMMSMDDQAARNVELAQLFEKVKGVKFFMDGQDQLLGAKMHTLVDASIPSTLPMGHVKVKMDIDGQSSKEFQEKLPDIFAEAYRQNLSMLPELEQSKVKMTPEKIKEILTNNAPNLVSMGTLNFKLDVEGEPSKVEGNVLLDIFCDLYGAKLTIDTKDGNLKGILRVTNADQLFADFEAYVSKLINDPDLTDIISPELKQNFPMYMTLTKTSLKSMAKESKDSKGNTVLEIEQTVPLAMVAGMAGGAAAAELTEPSSVTN